MAAPALKQLALDTNVVFDLAGQLDLAHDFRETCLERGYALWLPPTAVEELVHFAESGEAGKRRLAATALNSLLSWKILPYELDDLNRRRAKRFSKLLRDRGLLPREEENDGKILGEAALKGIPLLVTSDGHILEIDREQLQTAFEDCGLPIAVAPFPPRAILSILRARR